MKNTLILLVVLGFIACNSETTQKSELVPRKDIFRGFLKKFKPVALPFVYSYVTDKENIDQKFNINEMNGIDPASDDTLFVEASMLEQGEVKCFGMLSDTSKFFSLIFFYPSDSYYPVLVNYDKKGKLIDETSLIVKGCGSDCGLQRCSVTGIINKDLSIFCADTLFWEHFCDSTGAPVSNSDIIWIDTQKGRISKSGNINMDKEKHEELKAAAIR